MSFALQQQFGEHARARAFGPVDEAQVAAAVRSAQAADLLRVAARHEQALRAHRHVHQAMGVRRAASAGSGCSGGRLELADRHVQAGQVAVAARQRRHRLQAVAVAQLDRQLRGVQLLEQPRDREAVAGVRCAPRGRAAASGCGRARAPVRRPAIRSSGDSRAAMRRSAQISLCASAVSVEPRPRPESISGRRTGASACFTRPQAWRYDWPETRAPPAPAQPVSCTADSSASRAAVSTRAPPGGPTSHWGRRVMFIMQSRTYCAAVRAVPCRPMNTTAIPLQKAQRPVAAPQAGPPQRPQRGRLHARRGARGPGRDAAAPRPADRAPARPERPPRPAAQRPPRGAGAVAEAVAGRGLRGRELLSPLRRRARGRARPVAAAPR